MARSGGATIYAYIYTEYRKFSTSSKVPINHEDKLTNGDNGIIAY